MEGHSAICRYRPPNMGAVPSRKKDYSVQNDYRYSGAGRPSPPGKPFLVPNEANSGPDVVTIQWEAPFDNGGSRISGYLVEHRRAGSPHWVRATPVLVKGTELMLSGLEPGWHYHFRVSAQNAVGFSDPSPLSELITVTFHRHVASAPMFYRELIDTTALENEKVEFRVEVAGTPWPQISWYQDGFEVFSSRRQKIVSGQGWSSLIIYEAAMSDEGEIKCSATNRAGHAVSRARLVLQAPPVIRLPRQYEDGLLFEKDEIIRLKVFVGGRPSPTVSWFHDGELLMSGGRYEMGYADRYATLRVTEGRRSDRGEYCIRAVNEIAEDAASFLVTVTDRPEAPESIQVVMTLGRSVTLSWSEPKDDGGCKIGNYIIEYNRVGWNVWLKAATCRQLSTTLVDLIEGSKYKFRVKAENPYGVSEPSRDSDVIFIPDPKRGLLEPPGPEMDAKSGNYTIDNSNSIERDVDSSSNYPEIAIIHNSIGSKKNKKKRLDDNEFEDTAPKIPARKQKKKSKKTNIKDDSKTDFESSVCSDFLIPRENLGDFHASYGSSELMLVLLPDKSSYSDGEGVESILADWDDFSVAPPMSLSAPELGTCDMPETLELRNAVSSTELLHERAMARVYQALAQDEAESMKNTLKLERRHSFGSRTSIGKGKHITETLENKLRPIKNVIREDPPEIKKPDRKTITEEKENPSESQILSVKLSKPLKITFGADVYGSSLEMDDYNAETVQEPISLMKPKVEDNFDEEYFDEAEDLEESEEELISEEETYHPRSMVPRIIPEASVLAKPQPKKPARLHVTKGITSSTDATHLEAPPDTESSTQVVRSVSPSKILVSPSSKEKSLIEVILSPPDSLPSKLPTPSEIKPPARFSSLPMEHLREKQSSESKLVESVNTSLTPESSMRPESKVKSEPSVQLKPILKRRPSETPIGSEARSAPIACVEAELNLIPRSLSQNFEESEREVKRSEKKVRIEEPNDSLKSKIPDLQETKSEISGNPATFFGLNQRRSSRSLDGSDPKDVLISHYSDIVKEFGKLKKAPKTLYLNYEDLKAAAQMSEISTVTAESTIETSQINEESIQAEDESIKENPEPIDVLQEEPKVEEIIPRRKVLTPEEEARLLKVERKVSSICDFLLDFCLFLVACWLYLFENELYSIPFIILMIYRQLKETVQEKVNKWRKRNVD